MIQETVDKVIQFIGQNNYFHAPYLDFLGVYILGESWDWLEKGDKVILIKAYENNHDYLILNKLGEEVRLKYINSGTFQPLLIPESLKFYLGGLDD
jgi:hypothetical protein